MKLGLSLNINNPSTLFSPAILRRFSVIDFFGNGETGALYNPTNPLTTFQDINGKSIATVGDPVAMVLDTSQELVYGTELLTNGDFTDISAGWTKGVLMEQQSHKPLQSK